MVGKKMAESAQQPHLMVLENRLELYGQGPERYNKALELIEMYF